MNILRATILAAAIGCAAPAHASVCYQPDSVGGMDTWYGSSYNKEGMPTSDYLKVGGWGDVYASLLRFDLSGLPQQAAQAVLYLNAFSSGTPTAIDWRLPVGSWQEATAGFYSQPPVYYQSLGTTSAPSPGWYGINITGLYNMWRSGTSYPNQGLMMMPVSTNNAFTTFHSSDYVTAGLRPAICVDTASTESRIVLKWPLATAYVSRVINQGFGIPWSADSFCPAGVRKVHNGVDYRASAGTVVYAAEDGWVREVHWDSSGAYAWNVVIEHNLPSRTGTFTTVSWHLNPSVSVGQFVPKGMQIGMVADLGVNSHYHLGVRVGAYVAGVSGTGGLPTTNCGGFPAFSAGFISPEDTSQVIMQ